MDFNANLDRYVWKITWYAMDILIVWTVLMNDNVVGGRVV